MYAIIDIEATEDKNVSKIIEIAVVLVESNEIKETYTTLINPETNINPFVTSLTNITENDVTDAPTFVEVAHTIKNMINNHPIVGHNVSFDTRILNKELSEFGFRPLTNKTIDTVELARILLPQATKYNLTELAKQFNIAHEIQHRALSDTIVTARLFLTLKKKLFQLPLHTKKQLYYLGHTFKSDLIDLFYQAQKIHVDESHFITYNGLTFNNIFNKRVNRINNEKQSFGELCDTLYAQDGKLASVLHHYVKRDQQRFMSDTIYDCFRLNKHGIIEAGTGMGKTLAYLIPALYEAVENDEMIVISTEKVNLQLQIIEKELPSLKKALPFQFTYTSLKGKNHYLSLKKFNEQLNIEQSNYNKNILKAMILIWITETETGDINELNLPDGTLTYMNQMSAQEEYKISPWQQYSYYAAAFKKAEQSQLVVVNHALLAIDLHLETDLIPSYDKLIIDEAHHFPDIAEDQFSLMVDFQYTFKLIKKLTSINGDQLQTTVHYYLTDLYQYLLRLHKQNDKQEIVIIQDKSIWSIVVDMVNRISYSLEQLIHQLSHHNDYVYLLNETKQSLNQFGHLSTIDKYVVSFTVTGLENRKNIYLNLQQTDVSELLEEKLFNNKQSVILTSATLTTNNSFTYIKEQFGLTHDDLKEKIIPSSFNINKQTKLMVPSDFPSVNDDHYLYVMTEAILSLINSLHGNILILFTSHAMLQSVYYLLDELVGLTYNLMAQNITHKNNTQLVNEFKKKNNSILLGTNALWEGIDIPGEKLNCLIIVKLPFDNPNQMKHQVKQKELTKQGKNSFYNYTLPRMILRLKQGFGRLIRTDNDKGVIFVLDERIYTASYHETIIASIREYPLIYEPIKSLVTETEKWLK